MFKSNLKTALFTSHMTDTTSNMTDSRKPKLFRWALWWGLGIMVVCLAIIIIDAVVTMNHPSGESIDNQMMDIIYSLVYDFGIWPIIIYLGIIGPIIEELCFRSWGNGKSWTGFISVVLITLWAAALAWWLALITLCAGIAIMVAFEHDKSRRLFALMLYSSLFFALIHIGNYDPSEGVVMFIIAILHKFGMGLLASYLAINHGLLWSITLHVVNNSIIAAMMGVGFNMAANEVVKIDTEEFSITMRPVLTSSKEPENNESGWLNDSVFTSYNCPSYVPYYMGTFDSVTNDSEQDLPNTYTEVDYEWSEHAWIYIKVVMHGGSHNYIGVTREMEKEGWIAIDTNEDGNLFIRNTYDPLKGL